MCLSEGSVLSGPLWGSGHHCVPEPGARKGSPGTGKGMVKVGSFIQRKVKEMYRGGHELSHLEALSILDQKVWEKLQSQAEHRAMICVLDSPRWCARTDILV